MPKASVLAMTVEGDESTIQTAIEHFEALLALSFGAELVEPEEEAEGGDA